MVIRNLYFLLFFILNINTVYSLTIQHETGFEVRGVLLYSPEREDVEDFIALIRDKLAPNGVNTIIMMINYGYEFKSHPELKALDKNISYEDVKGILRVCRENGINLIPHLNLFGHQSSRNKIGKLLKVYPQFDETPSIKLPKNMADWKWPNLDSLYCKSYCPRHPDLHEILFDVIDELIDVFEATDFHGGMDEVIYIAHKNCPRCSGADPADIFAEEVNRIRAHLVEKKVRLWIAGDRLLDGSNGNIRFWEGSYNGTHRAINKIPKDIVIDDWHYKTAYKTSQYFAQKGFDVVTTTWNNKAVALRQIRLLMSFKKTDKANSSHYKGFIQSYWGTVRSFIEGLNNKPMSRSNTVISNKANLEAIDVFKAVSKEW